jgi:hypothetical protein
MNFNNEQVTVKNDKHDLPINNDDIINIKIDLETSHDINDFINKI